MTNFEKLKEMKLKDVFDFIGLKDEWHINVFMNMFQLINCRFCPAVKVCDGGKTCHRILLEWLESEVKEDD